VHGGFNFVEQPQLRFQTSGGFVKYNWAIGYDYVEHQQDPPVVHGAIIMFDVTMLWRELTSGNIG
jgi:hypothetical protein